MRFVEKMGEKHIYDDLHVFDARDLWRLRKNYTEPRNPRVNHYRKFIAPLEVSKPRNINKLEDFEKMRREFIRRIN